MVLLGLGLEVFGALQLAAEERPEQPLWIVVVALTVYGLGLGLASAQLTSLVLGDIPESLSDSAGGLLNALRAQGAPADIIAPLSKLFADATRLTLFSAVAALTIGFVYALMVRRSHAESDADGDVEAPTDAPVK